MSNLNKLLERQLFSGLFSTKKQAPRGIKSRIPRGASCFQTSGRRFACPKLELKIQLHPAENINY